MSSGGVCNVCGRQLDECGTCVCSSGRPVTFNGFLSMAVSDSVNGYASGVREDAAAVVEGRSADVRGECPDCGRHLTLRNQGEDGRCRACTDEVTVQTKTPERLRATAQVLRDVLKLNAETGWVCEADLEGCRAQAEAYEREAAELERHMGLTSW